MIDFSRPIRELWVGVARRPTGTLVRQSQYEFTYDPGAGTPVSLIMPVEDGHFTDGELFAVMDMNLPEGFLLAAIRERAPKTSPTKMHLLALMGENGIGWLGYRQPGAKRAARLTGVSRDRLLREGAGKQGRLFAELVDAYLSTGSGLSGVQPKVLVPERTSIAVPNLIVKAAGADYPGLAANEFLCLEVATRAGLEVATHALSDDGQLLLVDRFDLSNGARLGFEDIAALMDLRVGGALSDRKYRGSYEDIARVIGLFSTRKEADRARFFQHVALTVLLRNGDGHLKNFGVVYDETTCRLAPVFDVVTTTIYPYERANGARVTDRTLALKLRAGRDRRRRAYPAARDLAAFGRECCGVAEPRALVEPLFEAMVECLDAARRDERIPRALVKQLRPEWEDSLRVWRPRTT